jgi:ABC-type phosphate/phosphonate transport system substrate-binding protein
VVRNTLPPDLKARLQAAFIGLDRTDAGRQVLQQAEVNRYEETSDADFDAVRALMAPFLE